MAASASPAFDTKEMLTRLVKYLIEGLTVGIIAMVMPAKPLSIEEALLLALVAAAMFSILDMVAPSIGSSMRTGVGFGFGGNLIGFPMMGAR